MWAGPGPQTRRGSQQQTQEMKGIVFNLLEEIVSRDYGEPLFADRYPRFFDPHASTRLFVPMPNQVIHAEVRNLYPGADVAVFNFDTSSDEALVIG
jgi:hypothetical protein